MRALHSCSGDVHVARVVVSLVVHAVVGLTLGLIALVVVVVFVVGVSRSHFSVSGGVLFAPPVGDSKLRWLLPNITVILHQINFKHHSTNNWANHCFRKFPRSISAGSIVAVMSQMKDATKILAIAPKTRKSFATNFGNKLDPLVF